MKPLVAAAVLASRPDLASLQVQPVLDVRRVFGLPAHFRSPLYCGSPPGGSIDLTYFITCSNNQFAAELVMHSLAPPGALTVAEAAGGQVPARQIRRSGIADGYLGLYGVSVEEEVGLRRGQVSWSPFWPVRLTVARDSVLIPRVLDPWPSLPTLLETRTSETRSGLIAQFGFGGWLHRWSLPEAVQALARVLTDRRVSVAFSGGSPNSYPSLGLSASSWYGTLLSALRAVAVSGTAKGLAQGIAPLLDSGVVLYAKTGTLGEDDGTPVYVRSLLFGMGNTRADSPALACGVAGVVYFRFRARPTEGRALPPVHLRFFREALVPAISRFVGRSACPERGFGVAVP